MPINIFRFDGYNTYYTRGNYNRNDGVMAFVKTSLKCERNIITIGQTKCLEQAFKINNEVITLTSILYSYPNSCVELFNSEFLKYLDNSGKSDNHVITGDINVI